MDWYRTLNWDEETKNRHRLANKLMETVDIPGLLLEISRLKKIREKRERELDEKK